MLSFLLAISDLSHEDRILHVYQLYHTKMMRYAYGLLDHNTGAYDEEDVVQNVYICLAQFEVEDAVWNDEKRLNSYVMTMVKNEVLKMQRKTNSTENMDDYINSLVSDDDFVEQVNDVEEYRRIVKAIMQMEDRYSTPMYFYWVNGLTVKEIAERMKLPIKTVYTVLERGKVILLNMLGVEIGYGKTRNKKTAGRNDRGGNTPGGGVDEAKSRTEGTDPGGESGGEGVCRSHTDGGQALEKTTPSVHHADRGSTARPVVQLRGDLPQADRGICGDEV